MVEIETNCLPNKLLCPKIKHKTNFSSKTTKSLEKVLSLTRQKMNTIYYKINQERPTVNKKQVRTIPYILLLIEWNRVISKNRSIDQNENVNRQAILKNARKLKYVSKQVKTARFTPTKSMNILIQIKTCCLSFIILRIALNSRRSTLSISYQSRDFLNHSRAFLKSFNQQILTKRVSNES